MQMTRKRKYSVVNVVTPAGKLGLQSKIKVLADPQKDAPVTSNAKVLHGTAEITRPVKLWISLVVDSNWTHAVSIRHRHSVIGGSKDLIEQRISQWHLAGGPAGATKNHTETLALVVSCNASKIY